MQIRILTLRYTDGLQGFPDQAVREAAAGREILEVRDHFFVHGNVPHIALVLSLSDQPAGARPVFKKAGPAAGAAPSADLPEARQKFYRDLRDWRNERAKKDGVPSYVIMRNNLLAEICRRLPQSIANLREIDGIGEATCTKYGRDILAHVTAFIASTASENPTKSVGAQFIAPGNPEIAKKS